MATGYPSETGLLIPSDYVNQRICGKWNLHGSMHIPTLALVIIRVAENL